MIKASSLLKLLEGSSTPAKPAAPPVPVDRFPVCLPLILDQEEVDPNNWSDPKNYSVDPVPTFAGIEQSEYDSWRKAHGLATRSVREITQEEGYAIYRANYWLPHCPACPAGLDLLYFNSAVNQGTGEATEILQVALGIEKDGIWGPATSAAVSKITDPKAVSEAFTARQHVVYNETRYHGSATESKEVHADWTRRTTEIGADALKMVT